MGSSQSLNCVTYKHFRVTAHLGTRLDNCRLALLKMYIRSPIIPPTSKRVDSQADSGPERLGSKVECRTMSGFSSHSSQISQWLLHFVYPSFWLLICHCFLYKFL